MSFKLLDYGKLIKTFEQESDVDQFYTYWQDEILYVFFVVVVVLIHDTKEDVEK